MAEASGIMLGVALDQAETMQSYSDYGRQTGPKVGRITAVLREPGLLRHIRKGPVILLGHSAAGKSAVMEELSSPRETTDMDVYCRVHRVAPSLQTLRAMMQGARQSNVFVVSNTPGFLESLAAAREELCFQDVLFLYLKRPVEMIIKNLQLTNTDNLIHAPFSEEMIKDLYAGFEAKFRGIADVEILYSGYEIVEMAEIIKAIAWPALSPTNTMPSAAKGAPMLAVVAGHADHQSTRDSLLSDVTAWGGFPEYFSKVEEDAKGLAPETPLSMPEMRALTAGGYQSFDAHVFPPQPEERSISYKKLRDLEWTRADFEGKSVLEFGSQLGFFSFHALALGATEAVGLDLNPRFVAEANKLAVRYRKTCHWSGHLVRFVSGKVSPGDVLPVIPDVIVLNSVLHWWIIQNPDMSLLTILLWLRNNCRHGVYFEGCVTAEEPIMVQHGVDKSRFTEARFFKECAEVFSEVKTIGRCSYDNQRVVVRLLR